MTINDSDTLVFRIPRQLTREQRERVRANMEARWLAVLADAVRGPLRSRR